MRKGRKWSHESMSPVLDKGLTALTCSTWLFRRQSDQWPLLDLSWNDVQNVKSIKGESAKKIEDLYSQLYFQDYIIDFRVTLYDKVH